MKSINRSLYLVVFICCMVCIMTLLSCGDDEPMNIRQSWFTGTYTLEIPYSKGTKLHIGDSFKVKVQIGEYKGKTVVDGIKY